MERYKTVKVFNKSGRKKTLETGLTREEAQRYVQKDIDENGHNNKSMIVFYKQ